MINPRRLVSLVAVSFFSSLMFAPDAFAFKLPDTGQTTCYHPGGSVITCPPPGDPLAQDGSYDINPLSYTDNGDGTVTDNNTGLVWQQADSGWKYNWFEASGTYDEEFNPNSINVCGSLTLGGHSDWRLPTRKELLSIVNYEIPSPGPTIDTSVFVITQQEEGDFFWSSSPALRWSDQQWTVYFYDGSPHGVGIYPVGYPPGYVRCVRGGQLNFGNFHDNGDGTVTDAATGLTWQQGEGGSMSGAEALGHCELLTLGDYSDWRLPNIKELESITDDSATVYPMINTSFFPDAGPYEYWSSTTVAARPSSAWSLNFSSAHYGYIDSKSSYSKWVRCVRGGGPSVEYYQVDFEADRGIYSALLIEDSTAEVLGGFDTGELCFGGPEQDYYEGGPSDQKFWLRLEDRPGGGQTMHILSRFANQPIVRVIPCDLGSPQEGKSTLPRLWVGSGDEEPPQEWVEGGGTLGNPIQEPYERCDLLFSGSVLVDIEDHKGTYRDFKKEVRDPLRNSPQWSAEDVNVDFFRRSGAGYVAKLWVDTRLCRQAVADTIQLIPEETVGKERWLYLIDYD